ncbi:Tfp pilus assembly protein FimT/FimU [Rhodoferax sp. TS-BS-61-7]|uniref:pilus assembly FimT family protein n=1 Tax=Rhodoferax sp. TS-BS-61-7 TaxID=2094194 RepID=UPI000CF6144B|nr:type II secretion system protein [Rhodoferax sp. TS-BS-61-7]PQA77153.1 general secretion pathway protein GspH [Rhodoferax sp. TS-BS-61-7]
MNFQPVITRWLAAPAVRQRGLFQGGFTLVELVMVMVMLGVLAVFAAPRVFNRSDFEARGFHDQTLAALRFAQKTAIAQRRVVCVAFTINTVTLTRASVEASNVCDTAVAGPAGELVLQAPVNVAFTAAPAAFRFDGLGQALPAIALPLVRSMQVVNAGRTITVEEVTGYVHD